MKPNTRRSLILASVIGITFMASACGDDTDKDGSNIDVMSIQLSLTSNTSGLAADFARGLAFLEESGAIQQGMDSLQGSAACGTSSLDPVTGEPIEGSGADFDSGECAPEPAPELETDDLNDATAELNDILTTRIFTDENVEVETSKSVTYLLRGSSLCDGELGPNGETLAPDPDCVQSVDDAEIRLYVTSPSAGDIDVAIQVGPDRDVPLIIEVHQTSLAAELDLGAVKSSIEHLGLISGDMPELPQTMRGRARMELIAESQDRLSAQVSVIQTLEVANDDYLLSVGVATPAFRVTADAAAKTLEASLNMTEVLANFPESSFTYDDTTGVESEVIHDWAVALAGASANVLLDVNSDVVTMTNLGLGDKTSTLAVNGAQVLAVDLNADAGRHFTATATVGHEMVDVEISPEFDLAVDMDFANAVGVFDSIEDFMLDDVLTITLDGQNPTLHADENGLKVVSGQLTLAMQNEGTSVTVAAGQCLIEEDTGSLDLLTDLNGGVCSTGSASEGL